MIRFPIDLRPFCLALAAFAIGGEVVAPDARAASILVPNHSFEGPVVQPNNPTGVISSIDNWTMTLEEPYYQPYIVPQFVGTPLEGAPWSSLSGVFVNPPNLPEYASVHITNLDGNQAALMFGFAGLGIYQQLAATFAAEKDYYLTVGLVGLGGNMPENVPFALQLYYLSGGNKVIVDTRTVLHSAALFPDHTTVRDFTLDVTASEVLAAGAVGQQIGIQFIVNSTFGVDPQGGYWDVDNVRLVETPEPGSAFLMVLGGLALSTRRHRHRQA